LSSYPQPSAEIFLATTERVSRTSSRPPLFNFRGIKGNASDLQPTRRCSLYAFSSDKSAAPNKLLPVLAVPRLRDTSVCFWRASCSSFAFLASSAYALVLHRWQCRPAATLKQPLRSCRREHFPQTHGYLRLGKRFGGTNCATIVLVRIIATAESRLFFRWMAELRTASIPRRNPMPLEQIFFFFWR